MPFGKTGPKCNLREIFFDMDVSVIIVNYNTKELTKNCIDSIFKQTSGVSYEVILVDNASTDGSTDCLNQDKRIKFIQSDVNLGFGKANNLGYQYAIGKYVFLLNSDTILLNNAIKEFFVQMEAKDRTIACMGCLLVNRERRRTHSFGNYPTIWNELLRRPFRRLSRIFRLKAGFDDKIIRHLDDNCFEVEYVTGADLFIRKTVADEFGLFDPAFFMYYEETEMQYRYRKHGYTSTIINTPKIMHIAGGSQKDYQNAQWRSKDIDGCLCCLRKTRGWLYTLLFKVIIVLAYIPLTVYHFRYPIRERYAVLRKFAQL